MRKLVFISLVGFVFCGGCITNNYTCTCEENCKCKAKETIKANDPIVSPDKIDNTKQDDGAPHYPNIKPWYILN